MKRKTGKGSGFSNARKNLLLQGLDRLFPILRNYLEKPTNQRNARSGTNLTDMRGKEGKSSLLEQLKTMLSTFKGRGKNG
jgi:hypothetical protein